MPTDACTSFAAPKHVYRDSVNRGWRVRISRKEGDVRGFFGDSRYGDMSGSLEAATQFVLQAGVRKAFDGICLKRVGLRKLRVYRRLSEVTEEGYRFKFFIEAPASKNSYRLPWMREYVGTGCTVTDERIHLAVQRLDFRWKSYEQFCRAGVSRLEALERAGIEVPVEGWWEDGRKHLTASDLARWAEPPLGFSLSG